jgi:hypothetical protein
MPAPRTLSSATRRILVPLVGLAMALPCARADNEWVLSSTTSGAWGTPTNWLIPLVPLSTDNVLIGNGGTAVISTGSAVGKFLFVGGTAWSGSGALEIQGGSLATSGLILGSGSQSSGHVTQTGGSVTVSTGTFRGLQIGRGNWSRGAYTLSGGQLTITQALVIAPAGSSSGTFALSGSGILRTATTTISGTGGSGTGGLGRLLVTGGSASLGATSIGRNGTLDVSSGTVTAGVLTVGSGSATGSAVVRVAGGQLTATSLSLTAGGSMTLDGGTLRSTGLASLSGTLQQTDGLFQAGSLSVAAKGLHALTGGSMTIGSVASGSAAPVTVAGTLRLGGGGTMTAGVITTSASSALVDHGQMGVSVGDLAVNAGTYRMAAGTLAIASSWALGSGGTMDFANGTGAVTVSPGAAVNLSQGAISNSGSASLTILGSETLVILPAGFDPSTAFGSFTNEGTSYSVGGTLEILAGRTVQLSGTLSDPVVVSGTLRSAGGQGLAVTGGLTILSGGSANLGSSGGALYRSGTYTMGDGALVTGSLTVAAGGTASFSQSSGSIQAAVLTVGSGTSSSGAFDLSGGTLSVSQSLRIGAGDSTTSGTFGLRGDGVLQAGATTVSGTGLGAGGTGLMLVTAGSASLGTTTIGRGGVIDVSSGTVSTGQLLTRAGGVVRLTGGSVTAASLSVDSGGLATLEGGVLGSNAQVTVGGTVRQTGGLFQAGSLSVPSTGLQTITGGSLAVGTTSSGSTAAVTVAGTLRLDGSGTVTAGMIATSAAGALFDQVQAGVSVGDLAINAGTYRMSAGTLAIDNSWTLGSSGTMDFANGTGAVTVAPGSTVNLSQGAIVNSGSADVTILGSETFVIMPSGFDPATAFNSFTNEGTSYSVGGTLEILAGRTLQLSGVFTDPVIVAGALHPEDGTNISLTGGLTVLSGGSVSLGNGGAAVYRSGSHSMGDGVLSTGSIAVGSGGSASFVQLAGSIQAGSLAVGSGGGSVGTYDLGGGTLTVSQALTLGSGTGSSGTLTLATNGVLRAGVTTISGTGFAAGGLGALVVNGGSASLGSASIGRGGTLDVSTGLVAAGSLLTGSGATLRITGGTTAVTSLPVNAGGRVLLEGGMLTSSTANTVTGSMAQSGGTYLPRILNIAPGGLYALTGGTLTVGTGASGLGTLTLSGTFRLDGPATLDIGKIAMTLTSGKGLFDQRQSDVTVGDLSVTYGTYRMSSGTLGITQAWTLGSSGTMDFAGGTASVTVSPGAVANLAQGSIVNSSNASLTVLGANTLLIVPRGFDPAAAFASFSNEGTTYTAGSTLIVQNGRTVDLAGSFSDPIDTAGTINLTDATRVAADVSLASSGLITGTGQLTVVGAALRGTGTVSTDLRVESGAVAPGFSPGTLTLGGNWTLDPSSVLSIEIFGTAAGQFDRLVVAGTTTLSGSLAVTLGSALPLGASVTIIDNQSSSPIVGGFGSTVAATYASDLYTFSIDQAAGTGNDLMLTLTDITSVPEPTTAALGLAGLAGLVAALRRRRP